ncbi:hypothetical protein [Dysgonomonas sp. ZJ709]|uniref:hypothetical protein n=1 Tax=Dysgonomonas sp. ZJ709 TaxID=2709797 RepID=UPI0013ECC0AD|nr:hypothetical protein [Dysgonomonas sp. ZJ709]
MLQLEVGKIFPIEKYRNIGEKTFAILNENFFDTLLSIGDPSKKEIQAFNRGKLTIHLFVIKHVAFIIFDIKGLFTFDFTIDINKIKDELAIDQWLNSPANSTSLYLVNADTGILLGLRVLGLPISFAEKIRDVCVVRLEKDEFEAIQKEVHATISTDEMIKKSIMSFTFKY